ncbi:MULTISPECIES: hypothetical protein [unclassified Leisingera]|uniref:hypothetical protein n=1 Tax=unclassified Leisingera TaxID=2614906 RepID=UPI00057D5036|nr:MULTISPECIES: hypothetical protein [unclassified Leisingera]KIC19619.1 hypothetical protein RA21_03740 [Leisingera sp. ANG-DT]KIC30051.1 hypothetical protein RA24_03660 [Leisingera sp. ANG-M6]
MDFNIIAPMTVTDAELTASNIPENDHAVWDAGTSFGLGAKVISTTSHRIYESMQAGNQGNDPVSDDGTWWLDLKATNRWSAFDQRRSNRASYAEEITYSIVPSQDCDAISLFGLSAGSVQIEVFDGATLIYDQTFAMADTGHVVSMYTYFFGGVVFQRQKVLNGFPGYIGHRIDITISAPGSVAEVGHIVLGRNHILGEVMNLPNIQHVSHSRKGYDDFGDEILVKRGSTRRVEVDLIVQTLQAPRVMDIIAEVDGVATAFYLSGDAPSYGIEGLGFVDDHSQPIDIAGDSVFPLVMKTLK